MPTRPLACLMLLLAAGCARSTQALRPEEAREVAWYVEEVAHGLGGDPFELVEEDASEGKRNIALWALGHVEDVTPVRAPRQLESRARRWPVVEQGLRSGALVLDPSGLIALAVDISDEDRRIYRDAVESENLDRLAVTSLLLARGELQPETPRAEALIDALRRARLELGLRAGGRVDQPADAAAEDLPPRPPAPRRRM